MHAGDTRWLVLSLSTIANAILWTYYRRRNRKRGLVFLRTMSGPVPLMVAWAWAAPFYASMMVYYLSPSWMDWATIKMPGWVQTTSAIVLMLTPLLSWWVLSSLGDSFAEAFAAVFNHVLVTGGPYKYVRHPLYSLGCVLLSSIFLLTASWLMFAYAFFGIIIARWVVIPREEEYLLDRFGDTYNDYLSKTGRLIPRLTRIKQPVSSGSIC